MCKWSNIPGSLQFWCSFLVISFLWPGSQIVGIWIVEDVDIIVHLENICKAFLISYHMCMYVLVTEKNWLICRGHLSYTCNFITEFWGYGDSAMKIGMHMIICVLAAWLQMHPYPKGNIWETWAHAFSVLVFHILPSYLKGLHDGMKCCKTHSCVPCMTLYTNPLYVL